MNDIMQLYILLILISVSRCSVFIGFPESSWATSSDVCSLPVIEKINTTVISNESSNYMDYKKAEKAWTGTVIKYTKWAAFIGCGRSLAPMDSGISVKTTEDCLRHCSDDASTTYFIIKSSRCYCLTYKPEINIGDINDCRTKCSNASYTPCSSGRSALVFTFVEDLNIESTKAYIEKECLTTTKDKSKYLIRDCNATYLFGCKNTSSELIPKSWYEYQEFCLKQGSSVLYKRNTIGNKAKAGISYWTPIFRSHTVVNGKHTGKEFCLAVSNAESKYFIVENCTSQFPFLCSGDQMKNMIDNSKSNDRYPRYITLPLPVVVAVILFVIILIFIIVLISTKAFKKIRIYQEKLKKVNERLPGTEFSNYTGIEDTNEELHDSAYKELSDNVSQLRTNCHERKMDTSEDTFDYQDYLVPEQHYHTIPDVEVHYDAADVAERNSNKENFDSDDYLEPVI
ncbi:uncharacterized protein LOC127709319 isoform X2 [Mytilus californianus]|uniref:uncharacterized protein LOC127709319 isoform X2 n=1 Tax=Mytilus californianus TaxID=6549 RepID=UPI00224848C6|nr:uncharacterized protein LOC127709319 isoform X2 [Mytilus californianus]